jgi:hypothetical protein
MENQLVDLSENPSQQMLSDGPSSPSQNSVESSAGNILPNRTELNRNLVLPRASLQETPPSTGHWCKPPLQNTLGSKLNRLSSTNGRRSGQKSIFLGRRRRFCYVKGLFCSRFVFRSQESNVLDKWNCGGKFSIKFFELGEEVTRW